MKTRTGFVSNSSSSNFILLRKSSKISMEDIAKKINVTDLEEEVSVQDIVDRLYYDLNNLNYQTIISKNMKPSVINDLVSEFSSLLWYESQKVLTSPIFLGARTQGEFIKYYDEDMKNHLMDEIRNIPRKNYTTTLDFIDIITDQYAEIICKKFIDANLDKILINLTYHDDEPVGIVLECGNIVRRFGECIKISHH